MTNKSNRVLMLLFVSLIVVMLGSSLVAAADSDRLVRKLFVLTRPQASAPDEFESTTFVVDQMKQLGLDAEIKVMPWEQLADVVWYEREKWDMSGWQMTARPERLDPDEFTYNLFHSSTAETGYNFIGYVNPEYDKLAEEQRVTIDQEKRKELIYQAQAMIAQDAAYDFLVHPKITIVYNNKVFKPESIKEMAGLGAKNFWTYVNAEPIADQKNLILNSNDSVIAINPFYISGTVDSWITELVWDRLMRMGEDGLPKPWAAQSVEWIDNTQVKVVLRDGMKWSDGEPVTVEDVKFSFEAPLTGEVPMYKPFVDIIENIEIVDDSTLLFTLKRPNAAFETSSLAKVNIVPQHVWEPILKDLEGKPENAESYQEDVPVGSGPFKFSNWEFSQEVVLEANKEHFQAPKVNKWIVRFTPNMSAALGMIQNGELNFLTTYLGDKTLLDSVVQSNADLTMVTSVDLGYKFIAFNHRRAPFSDQAFRRAIAAITDRRFIADAFWKGFAVPANSVVSPALDFWHNPELNYPSGGIEAARKMLKDAGYEWDSKGRLLYPEGETEELQPSF